MTTAPADIYQLARESELKSDVLNNTAHEIRTPLTSIAGYLEFLEDEIEGPLTKGQRAFVSQIQRETDRLRRLVDDMLDFARIESGALELNLSRVNIHTLINNVIKTIRPQAKRANVKVYINRSNITPKVMGDPERIEQVLLNLLSNAIKFSPEGGTILIDVVVSQDSITVEVHDEGSGISEEDQERLFNRFYQVKSSVISHKGTGLGLAISRSIINAHNGIIGVVSQPGIGSNFWFSLSR